jgi:ABC-type histidine transport system ATPase subunit
MTDGSTPTALRPLKLEVTDLHKRYGDHEVLKGVSLRAHVM